jgi:hypothetical protein
MKQGTVKFSKEFITSIGLKEWITLEWPVDMPFDEEKAMETYIKVREFVCNNQVNNPGFPDPPLSPGSPPTITIEKTSEDQRVAELIRDIYACTEIEGDNGLHTYRKLASTCKEAQQVFDMMFRKLSASK